MSILIGNISTRQMMYWRPNVDSSKVEALLNTQGVTLNDILKEDGVINEVQVFNEKLLNYLMTPEHITDMLHILITTPQPNDDGVLYFGDQNVVSEILSSYVNVIYSTLSSNAEYLTILFQPFIIVDLCDGDQNQELVNSVTCSLIFKVAKVLCQQSSEKLLNFLMSTNGILDQFVRNIECNSVVEFLIKCIQSFQPSEVLIQYLKWLSQEDITGKLLAKIDSNGDSQVCIKAIQCLIELLAAVKSSKVENPLILDLQSTRVVTHILSMMLTVSAGRMSVIGSGLEFIKSMFEIPEKQSLSSFSSPIYQSFKKISITSQDISENPSLYNPIIDCLVLKLSDFKSILEDTSELSKICIPTAYGGEIVGPLGPHRLALIDLIHHLVLLEQERIYSEIINSQIISTLLNLFFEFHLNTFLHRFVTEIINKLIIFASASFRIQKITDSNNNIGDIIIVELFVNQDLLNKIVHTWNNNMTSVSGTNTMIRNTHRPFLKEIANIIEKEINNFAHLVNSDTLQVWRSFAETNLAEENKKNTIKKKNLMSYPDSSSEGEGPVENIDDIDAEDTLKIYEDCIQQEMTNPFPDYNYKPIFVTEKSSLDTELNSNPLTDFFITTQEDIENAENFESVCNVMLSTRRACDTHLEQTECLTNNEMDLTLTNDVENIEDIYENNYKSSNVQTNIIDSVFREAYKDLNQPPKHHEIKILDSRSSSNHQSTTNNRFQFRTSTGLPILNEQKNFRNPNHSKIEKLGDSIRINSTIVPRLKFDDNFERKEGSRSIFITNSVRALSDDKETQRGSPFCVDDEDIEEEMPLSSTARYILREKSSEFSDESDDEDLPLSSRLEKGQMKLPENLSELDNSLDDKTWNNPSNNQIVSSEEIELEFDTVQDVTPNLVITHCNSYPSKSTTNYSEKEESPEQSVPVPMSTCVHSADNASVQPVDHEINSPVANIEVLAIENPFSPKLIRHTIHNSNKETGINKTKLFESSKCLTLSSNSKSNNIVDFKPSSGLTSRHTFSSILCPLPWTSFQTVNRSISAPTKININSETSLLNQTNTESTKSQSLVNGLDESNSGNSNSFD